MGLRKKGKGPLQDLYTYEDFHRDLLNKGLDREIIYLYTCRVAADHYTLNPTKIKIFNKEIQQTIGKTIEISISPQDTEHALQVAKIILNNI